MDYGTQPIVLLWPCESPSWGASEQGAKYTHRGHAHRVIWDPYQIAGASSSENLILNGSCTWKRVMAMMFDFTVAHLHHIGQDLHPISANCLHQWQDLVRHQPWSHDSYLCVYCASYILHKTIILESTVVALPFWHLLTASVALAETPTAGAADDPVDSSWKYSPTEWKYS